MSIIDDVRVRQEFDPDGENGGYKFKKVERKSADEEIRAYLSREAADDFLKNWPYPKPAEFDSAGGRMGVGGLVAEMKTDDTPVDSVAINPDAKPLRDLTSLVRAPNPLYTFLDWHIERQDGKHVVVTEDSNEA